MAIARAAFCGLCATVGVVAFASMRGFRVVVRWQCGLGEAEMRVTDFEIGQRVQMHPATDAWMRGLRFGTVVRIVRGKEKLAVLMDGRDYTLTVRADLLLSVES